MWIGGDWGPGGVMGGETHRIGNLFLDWAHVYSHSFYNKGVRILDVFIFVYQFDDTHVQIMFLFYLCIALIFILIFIFFYKFMVIQ